MANEIDLLTFKGFPNQTISNITLISTPLTRAAQEFARAHDDPVSPFIYNHVMRSWLFGALIISRNSTLAASVDLEVHAAATLLHDLGWDRTPGSGVVSGDRRFEVDGAEAGRRFIAGFTDTTGHDGEGEGNEWDERRLQLVWDAIALHTERRIAYFKELEVQVVSRGIALDFEDPKGEVVRGYGITEEEYGAVVGEFGREGFKRGVNETVVWLCGSKPGSTIDTWMQPWGDRYVANYSSRGRQRIDSIFANL
ncbi:hypothetical protein QBC42DRAFT_308599 [Cladorrhinum samala]|uniref:HD domain-containing protein n=1 Tax=Cladorrhinum samala TaxID=585594 RepID=A0AAV9HD11_9PEZI|nr:hypothetical protein QBC42DRAFT_308599 [Cladorrhinum samala]